MCVGAMGCDSPTPQHQEPRVRNCVSVAIAQHLDLNVAGLVDKFLNQHAVITKGCLGFHLGQAVPFQSFLVVPSNSDALSTTSSRRFNHHWVPDFIGCSTTTPFDRPLELQSPRTEDFATHTGFLQFFKAWSFEVQLCSRLLWNSPLSLWV